jgi:Zn-dependent peptidase ImmA (M78 family)
MGINLKTLGGKLRKYREQLQESLSDVAVATGIEGPRLSAIEVGAVEPSGDEVLILSDHYRCDYKFFVSNERAAPFEQTETLYRAHGDDFSKEDRRSIQDFLYLCETEAFLTREMGISDPSFKYSPRGGLHKDQGAAGAAALRSYFGYEDRAVPRDVFSDFRKAGIRVFRRKLGNSAISGLFVMHPTAGKCVLVNLSEDIYRQRFSAAHEMAHAVFDADQEASVSYFVSQGKDLREIRANRFASAYLMPPVFLSKLPDPSRWDEAQAIDWANKLRVSCDALGIALKEAGLIGEAKSRCIRKLRVPREDKMDPELPATLNLAQRARKSALLESGLSDFYVGLCFDAAREGVISTGRLAEALFCGPADILELASMYGRTPHGD